MNTSGIGRRNAIPIIYTCGTHYEVGFDVGRTFRGIIEDFISNCNYLKRTLLPGYETEKGKAAYDETLNQLQESYPQYVDEIRGTADGAKVPFYYLMLLHMDMIVPKSAGIEYDGGLGGCSSISCNYQENVILGHTEDAESDVENHIYIVDAHIIEPRPRGRWETKHERYRALCYAGHLPGYCMGYNQHGFVYSINLIFPATVLAGKTPRHILCRALLSADSLERATNILTDEGVGCADGFNVNMFFTKEKEKRLFRIVEVCHPISQQKESQLSMHTLKENESYLHVNVFQQLNAPEDLVWEGESSQLRLTKFKSIGEPKTKDDVIQMLSDTSDSEYPFYRNDSIKTVTIGIFDMQDNTWTLWMKSPKESKPITTLPFKFDPVCEEF